jgi:hypothetical protein
MHLLLQGGVNDCSIMITSTSSDVKDRVSDEPQAVDDDAHQLTDSPDVNNDTCKMFEDHSSLAVSLVRCRCREC